jgi:hypothetical protein
MSTRHRHVRPSWIAPALGIALLLSGASRANAQSPWLPDPGTVEVSHGYTFHHFDRIWMGGVPADFPGGESQHSFEIGVEIGMTRRVAVDVRAGFTATRTVDVGSGNGLTDTAAGIRWRLLDELEDEAPATVAVRLGGIVAGTYAIGHPGAPGDGAGGVEASVLVGRTFGGATWGLSGELGARARAKGVPPDAFGGGGVFRNWSNGLSVSGSLNRTQALSGIDIGDPGFTPARFPETREVVTAVEAGLSWAHGARRHLGVTWARAVSGRNTGQRSVLSVGYSVTLGRVPVF